jgi:acetamidase/formamidase
MLTAAAFAALLAQTVVRYEPKESDLKYVFGVAEPVARVKPGDVIDTKTFDCFVNKIRKPGDTLKLVPGDNPLTGPFYVDGAEPGDTLVVKILQLDVDGDQGVAALAPGFGALNTTNYPGFFLGADFRTSEAMIRFSSSVSSITGSYSGPR